MADSNLRLALAQLNFLVGDIAGNARRVKDATLRAKNELGAHAVIFPELALTGYPPEDLLLRPGLHRSVRAVLTDLCQCADGIDIIIGYPARDDLGIYNACSVLRRGKLAATYHKQHLPNYSVFDEKRYFSAGTAPCVIDIRGVATALTICEDIWAAGTARQARDAGAELILNINASPFHAGKVLERRAVLRAQIDDANTPIVYVNQVGGQDELVFDGASMVLDARGDLQLQAPEFQECITTVELSRVGGLTVQGGKTVRLLDEHASIYRALQLGTADYINKNGFRGAVLGLSGGIDSALTLAIAADALGPERIDAVMMPSRFTANMSLEDARSEAEILQVAYHTIDIEGAVAAINESLRPLFRDSSPDTTEENIQSRCRGVLLMALSNKLGSMVLATGNKSEMAVGYATLYGDMAGGFAPLKDVFKTLVYDLARWRNAQDRDIIPQRVITRPPSAELAEDQADTDSLPPYEILDPILEAYIEQDRSPGEIVASGFDAETVQRVVRMVDRNEYKRRQAAPGVRITPRAFGRDRRYPITSGYRELD